MTASQPSPLRRLDVWLSLLLGLTLIAILTVLIGGSRVLPWDTAARVQSEGARDAKALADRAITAFLDVDHRDMQPRIKAVTDLSTGEFAAHWETASVDLTAAAELAKAISSGKVRYVGLNSLTNDKVATVLVAADTVVRNTSTRQEEATDACPHKGARCDRYRFLVEVTHTEDGWRMSDLAGVP